MGFLSDSAKKAYRSGARRAYVPEWFVPASYVFGVVIVLVLAYGIVFSEPPRPQGTEPTQDVIVLGGPTDGAVSADVAVPAGTTPGDEFGAANDAENPMPLLDGGETSVPTAAWDAAQKTVFALFTGDFSDVNIYPGKTAPVLLTTWTEPSIVGLLSFEEYPDGTARFVVRVDPDTTGSEAARDVPLLMARHETGWAYLPG
jgi:hypothetical protein